MKGMIILQGDEEGKKLFMDVFYKRNKCLILKNESFNCPDFIIEQTINSECFPDYFFISTGIDCETTKYLQDYYPFYIVKVFPYAYKIVNNYKDGKFLLGCKSDSFESDVNKVLRLVSI